MNPVLQIKGPLQTRKNPQRPRSPQIRGCLLTVSHISALRRELADILSFWEQHPTIGGALVSVHYNRIVPKSRRISILLAEGKSHPSKTICGAKFEAASEVGRDSVCHVFTHFVSLRAVQDTISLLDSLSSIADRDFAGRIDDTANGRIGTDLKFPRFGIGKNDFVKAVIDAASVFRFSIQNHTWEFNSEAIVSLYRTGGSAQDTLAKFGISVFGARVLNDTTVLLTRDQIGDLMSKAPYLVSMGLLDLREVPKIEPAVVERPDPRFLPASLPHPQNEPIIGVIDTQFDENAYFHEWVEYRNELGNNFKFDTKDYYHGTAVSSIIVDGHRANPELNDGCGHFRVRHFGVAVEGHFSSFEILRSIRKIVASNLDIKVWNLSLGSVLETSENSISPEAAELDRLQKEYDILFVVAGTNVPREREGVRMRVGAPADSLNSVVVNSVNGKGQPASYTRVGPVLSFFDKPDVACFGGDKGQGVVVCIGDAPAQMVSGTSFAAPWISRKLAFMIGKLGLSREIAKALLLDSAAKWAAPKNKESVGYGVVPKTIGEIMNTPNDEIRFFLSGVSEEFETYTFNLPVPVVRGAHPYFARAVLAYFPSCDRSQGVDYTGTELDVRFGRVKNVGERQTIAPIDRNSQGDDGGEGVLEKNARALFRKWDNVKRIAEEPKHGCRPRVAYDRNTWGLCIKSKARNADGGRDRMPFGVVVTLKEMNGVNRIDDFIQHCFQAGWLVNRINVESQVEIYNQGQMELPLE